MAPDWDERFYTPGYVYGEAPSAFLAGAAAHLPGGGRALAVADGEGRNGVWLATRGLSVTSVDISSVGLAKARSLAQRQGVRLETVQADFDRWTWPEAEYDVVAAIFIQFAPPAMRDRIFARMAAALAPGGLLLLHGYRPEQVDLGTGGPPQRENMYDVAMLKAAFAGLEILELRAYDAVIEEGEGHSGLSALIDLVARRPG